MRSAKSDLQAECNALHEKIAKSRAKVDGVADYCNQMIDLAEQAANTVFKKIDEVFRVTHDGKNQNGDAKLRSGNG